jgi:uncharacterized protein (TIGR02268 family)
VLQPTATLRLLLVLLVGGAAVAQSNPTSGTSGVRHIELLERVDNTVHEVAISPGLTTAFRFHGATLDLEAVTLEGRERLWVSIAEEAILVVPSEQVVPGQRLRLTVRFKDGGAPASFDFMLVVHPDMAERQVEVYRQRRSSDSLRAEVREKDARLRECQAQVELLRAEQKHPEGLSGLIAAGHLDDRGVAALDLIGVAAARPGESLGVRSATSFRSAQRVAVELWLEAPEGAGSWDAKGTQLRSGVGEELTVLTVWQDEAVSSGAARRVVVEANATKDVARVPFVLTLRGADSRRSVTVGNVVFP